jgi:hypothetical protein
VEMHELEAMHEILRLQHLGCRQNLSGAQAELRVFATAFSPASRPFGEQTRADAQQRFDAELF